MFHYLTPLIAVALLLAPLQPAPQPARATSPQTALDRYVAAPDPSFAWKVVRELPAEGATATLIEMTSQRWLTEQEVERPLWTHWITVVRPATVKSDIALLFIGGGSNDRQPPARPPAMARRRGARHRHRHRRAAAGAEPAGRLQGRSGAQAAIGGRLHRLHLGQVPAHRRREVAGAPADDEERRARDGRHHGVCARRRRRQPVSRFVVSGASKRGWTTWTTAAVDTRVIAIAPAVIDMLNVEPSFVHHWRVYGAWSEAVKDYVEHGIMDWMGTPQFRALMRIEEPYEYRDRLTMPKFLLNASGDQFFLPDSSQFYFDDLRGENAPALRAERVALARQDRRARERAGVLRLRSWTGTPRPEITWTFERDGSIKVVVEAAAGRVLLWQATNPDGAQLPAGRRSATPTPARR